MRPIMVLVGCVFVAACGSNLQPSPGPAETGLPGATGTPALPTPPATASAPSLPEGEPCAVTPAESIDDTCPMPAGAYHSRKFAPGVAFTLVNAWRNVSNEPDVVAIFDGNVHWLTFVSGAPHIYYGPSEPVSTAKKAKDLWSSSNDLKVIRLKPERIAGLSAVVFEMTNTGDKTKGLFDYPATPGTYYLDAEVTVRIYWLTIDDLPTLVLLEAPADEFKSWIESQKPFLESIGLG